MFSAAISAVGLNEMYPILIIAGMLLLIVIVAIIIWGSGSLGDLLNGVDKKTYERLAYDSVPKLREIVTLYPRRKVGIQARIFLEGWDNEIEPSLERMDQSKKKKKLRSLYQSNIHPILEAYKQITES